MAADGDDQGVDFREKWRLNWGLKDVWAETTAGISA